MWPFTRSPEHRLHHRLLDRLREAYVIGEDLTTHRLIEGNLRRISDAHRDARDDAVLFPHWFGKPMKEYHALALSVEQALWFALGVDLHKLQKQEFIPDAFQKEAEELSRITDDLQHVLHLETLLVTKAPLASDEAYLENLKRHYP